MKTIRNPCKGCGRKPNCPEPCFPKRDYEKAIRKRRKRGNDKNRQDIH